jgi:hypothetical protein
MIQFVVSAITRLKRAGNAVLWHILSHFTKEVSMNFFARNGRVLSLLTSAAAVGLLLAGCGGKDAGLGATGTPQKSTIFLTLGSGKIYI